MKEEDKFSYEGLVFIDSVIPILSSYTFDDFMTALGRESNLWNMINTVEGPPILKKPYVAELFRKNPRLAIDTAFGTRRLLEEFDDNIKVQDIYNYQSRKDGLLMTMATDNVIQLMHYYYSLDAIQLQERLNRDFPQLEIKDIKDYLKNPATIIKSLYENDPLKLAELADGKSVAALSSLGYDQLEIKKLYMSQPNMLDVLANCETTRDIMTETKAPLKYVANIYDRVQDLLEHFPISPKQVIMLYNLSSEALQRFATKASDRVNDKCFKSKSGKSYEEIVKKYTENISPESNKKTDIPTNEVYNDQVAVKFIALSRNFP